MMNQARHESSGVKLEVNERWVPLPAPGPGHEAAHVPCPAVVEPCMTSQGHTVELAVCSFFPAPPQDPQLLHRPHEGECGG